ncbi:MAG: hypothetical protein OXE52_07040 [Chloroflexi bacterium]|nr:hypothetical protein [Chloroflexota bacterium]
MAWTTPKTDWETGELIAASDINAVNENMAALKNPASAVYTTTERISTTSRTFADVDSNNLNLTITTTGGDVLVQFSGTVNHDSGAKGYYDVEIDGTRQGGDDGIRQDNPDIVVVAFAHLFQNMSAGTHTFKLQWRTNTGTLHIEPYSQFWVREIS